MTSSPPSLPLCRSDSCGGRSKSKKHFKTLKIRCLKTSRININDFWKKRFLDVLELLSDIFSHDFEHPSHFLQYSPIRGGSRESRRTSAVPRENIFFFSSGLFSGKIQSSTYIPIHPAVISERIRCVLKLSLLKEFIF